MTPINIGIKTAAGLSFRMLFAFAITINGSMNNNTIVIKNI
jgi:hypothetical protein